jgi:hypothetical protein
LCISPPETRPYAFKTSKESHICKNFDGRCDSKNKHIRVYHSAKATAFCSPSLSIVLISPFFERISLVLEVPFGQNLKGVLINYKSNKADNHISEAKELLAKSPFESCPSLLT